MRMKSIAFFLLTVFAFAFLAACDFQRTIEVPYGAQMIEVDQDSTRFFSLVPFQEVTGAAINSTVWDIAFSHYAGYRRTVLTNSGVTAERLETGGRGGAWHTGNTDLDAATPNDGLSPEDLPYYTDVYRYIAGMGGDSWRVVNVMTYVGYETGTGIEGDPYGSWQYDRRQFYTFEMGGAGFAVTNEVYIIRHGCGLRYSAIQIVGYTSADPEIYILEFRNFY